MKKYILFLVATWVTLCFCPCNDERIYEKEMEVQRGGRVLKLTGRFSGISNWTDDYSVVVTGSSDKSECAIIARSLPINVTGGTDIITTLGGVSDEVKSLKLCVISRLREYTIEFKAMEDEELATTTDTILMNAGILDVGMFSSVQSQVFDKKYVTRHGQTGPAPGDLFLAEGKSYYTLVSQPTHKDGDILLVRPGNAEESLLHLVPNRAGNTSMSHIDILSEGRQPLSKLVGSWINEGISLNNE